jgi:biopolymer transport protein ExbB
MLEKIIQGGYMMVPLLACSVVAVAVLIDRFLVFRRVVRIDNQSLRAQVLELVRQRKLLEAARLCSSTPGPVSAVMLTGIQTFVKYRDQGESPETIRACTEKAMEDYALHAMHAVEKRLNILTSIGNAAPLFGMTGTVTGMIASFKAMQAAAGLDQGAVARGISEALITTAAGLLIALLAVIPYNQFVAKVDELDLQVGEASAELLEYLTVRSDAKASE